MKVFIITEGGSSTGFGHVTRCISLYQAFEERGIQPFLIISGDRSIHSLLNDNDHAIFDWIREEQKLLRFIKNADIVVIDSYLAGYNLYEKVSKLTKTPVYIDDNKRIDYPKGFIVNGAIYAEDLHYCKRKDVTPLLGSQYIPLRKEFWNVPDKEIRKDIATIMITFGGDDLRNMTPGILKLLKENFPAFTKKVIIGKGFKNIEWIESFKNGKTDFIYYPNAEVMKRVMLESDMAISASGQTLYEFARIGVPTIAVTVVDNQMNNAKGWQKAGFIEYAGWWKDENILSAIASKVKLLSAFNLRKEKSAIGRRNVDGLGALKIVEFVTNGKL